MKRFKGFLNEQNSDIKINKEIIDEVNKFPSIEELLRSGGISTDLLDKAAYGFCESDIVSLMPNQLSIKWTDDLENVEYEINCKYKKSGQIIPFDEFVEIWSKEVDLSEPIEVSYKDKKFYIEDGHHRYYAAKTLNVPLNVELEIKSNPILILAPNLSYDDFHRVVFNQVKNLV